MTPAIKAPAIARWGTVELQTADGAGVPFAIESRSGATATADSTWSPWSKVEREDARVSSTPANYMQFRIHVREVKGEAPLLKNLHMSYQAAHQPPTVKFTDPAPGLAISGTKEVKWDSGDPDADALDEALFLSRDDGRSWTLLAEAEPASPAATENKPATGETKTEVKPAAGETKPEAKPAPVPTKEAEKPAAKITNKTYAWDTKSVPNGPYQLKIVSSDLYARPADPKSAEAVINVLVNNTPPTVDVPDHVTGIASVERLELKDALTPITSAAYRLDDHPWTALVPEDGIFGSKHLWVKLIIPADKITLAPGDHRLTVQAKDAAGNLMNRVIRLTIP